MRQKQHKHRREHFPASWIPIKSVHFIKQNKKTNDVPLRLSCLAKITGHSLTRINQSRLTERKKEATVHWHSGKIFFSTTWMPCLARSVRRSFCCIDNNISFGGTSRNFTGTYRQFQRCVYLHNKHEPTTRILLNKQKSYQNKPYRISPLIETICCNLLQKKMNPLTTSLCLMHWWHVLHV